MRSGAPDAGRCGEAAEAALRGDAAAAAEALRGEAAVSWGTVFVESVMYRRLIGRGGGGPAARWRWAGGSLSCELGQRRAGGLLEALGPAVPVEAFFEAHPAGLDELFEALLVFEKFGDQEGVEAAVGVVR